ncbi:hypothetical protein XELAEV_18017492mg [Xenopus laevis]|uniref:Helix-turn-helix domain-containing protein n=1 Tax=Xenopus laevis TaxID=8355 RepID=A0A974HSG7_XENLA|nr:hypothetical protein XELAEV_18017492mg [Xenopus laevis]
MHGVHLIIQYHLMKYSDYSRELIYFLLDAVRFLLEHNYFTFDANFYLQKRGTAMGAKFAPSYANLYMGWWEETHISIEQKKHLKLYLRYIDNLLCIWQGTQGEFDGFVKDINANELNLRFTSQFSLNKIEFLDVMLVVKGKEINTSIFRKPFGQFLRLRRNCSSNKDFCKQARDMRERFLERGYKQKTIQKVFQRAKGSDRNDLLKGNAHFFRILSPGINVIPKWAHTLRDMLSPSHFRSEGQKRDLGPLTSIGNYKCGSHRCITCKHMNVSKKFRSTVTGREFDIKGYIKCNTTFVIYLITCLKCRKQARDHISQIKNPRTAEKSNITRHFAICNGGDIDDFSIQGIERVRLEVRGGDQLRLLERREVYWIFHLGTCLPLGLNYEFDVTCYI